MKSPYATNLQSVLNDGDTKIVLEIFERIAIQAWLERHPFQTISVESNLSDGGIEINGLYSYSERTTRISTQRDTNSFGQILEWGKTDKVSDTANSLLQCIQFTLLHELGHHVHAELRFVDSWQFGSTLRAVRTNAVSQYAKMPNRPLEYFAETFAAWVLYPTELILFDRLGYDMIHRALTVLDVDLRQ